MDRTIRVKGMGKISVKPDRIRLNLSSKEICKRYDEAIEKASLCTKKLRETMEKAGLDSKDLKTLIFDIDTEYESYRDRNDDYKRRFIGYSYSHKLYIEFPNNNKLLGRVLYELSKCEFNVEFFIRHTVKDVSGAKNILLEKAVEDSKIKAEILSKAAGVKLGEVINIDYSWGELEIFSSPIKNFALSEASINKSIDIDIEADDIDLEDTVTIVWEIK